MDVVMSVNKRSEYVVDKLGELIRLVEPYLKLEFALCARTCVEPLDNVGDVGRSPAVGAADHIANIVHQYLTNNFAAVALRLTIITR